MRWTFAILVLVTLAPSAARAEDELTSLSAVHEACERVGEARRTPLYAMEVEYRLGRYDEARARLYVDTRRNLRALERHVSLLVSGLEPVSFDVAPNEVEALRRAASRGATLRVGFFLGFDDTRRQPCVLRGEHAVTVVRADLAYAELRTAEGQRLARMETERLRAWLDDQRALAIPGEGPRGIAETLGFGDSTAAPDGWQRALESAAVRARFAQCHAEGIARGAAADARVVVRLNIETRTGRVRRADVALSSLGDDEEAECIARALGGATLPPGPASWAADVVDLSVSVRLVD